MIRGSIWSRIILEQSIDGSKCLSKFDILCRGLYYCLNTAYNHEPTPVKNYQFKAELDDHQAKVLFPALQAYLGEVWNDALKRKLFLHSYEYYRWLKTEKVAKYLGLAEMPDLTGIVEVPVRFPRKSAYMGATCPIAWVDRKTGEYNRIEPEALPQTPPAPPKAADYSSGMAGTSKIIQELLKNLDISWEGWLKGQRGKPRIRRMRENPVLSIASSQSDKIVLELAEPDAKGKGNDFVSIPATARTFGKIKIQNRGISRRFGRQIRSGELVPRKITLSKEADGFYVTLTLEKSERVSLKNDLDKQIKRERSLKKAAGSNWSQEQEAWLQELITALKNLGNPAPDLDKAQRAIGVDPGVAHFLALSNGKFIDRKDKSGRQEKREKRAARLQKAMSRRKPGSKGYRAAKEEKAVNQGKIAANRKAFSHKVSSQLVKDYDVIVFEDTQLENMVRAPKAKPNTEGTGYEKNGAAAKAGLNKAILNQAIGQVREMTEEKATRKGKIAIRAAAPNSSRRCRKCGHTSAENRPNQETFLCQSCGHTEHADTHAAINHLNTGLDTLGLDRLKVL